MPPTEVFHNIHKKLLHPILTYLICLMNELLTVVTREGYVNTQVEKNHYLWLTTTGKTSAIATPITA